MTINFHAAALTSIPLFGQFVHVVVEMGKRGEIRRLDQNSLEGLEKARTEIKEFQMWERSIVIGTVFQTVIGVVLVKALQWTLLGTVGIVLGVGHFAVSCGLLLHKTRWLRQIELKISQVPGQITGILSDIQTRVQKEYVEFSQKLSSNRAEQREKYSSPSFVPDEFPIKRADLPEYSEVRVSLYKMTSRSPQEASRLNDVLEKDERYSDLYQKVAELGRDLDYQLNRMDANGNEQPTNYEERHSISVKQRVPLVEKHGFIRGIDQAAIDRAPNEGIEELFHEDRFLQAQQCYLFFERAMIIYMSVKKDSQKIADLRHVLADKEIWKKKNEERIAQAKEKRAAEKAVKVG